MIVDLPLHPLDLLTQRRREIVMPSGRRLFCLLCEHGERRLESVRRTRWMPDGKAIAFIAPDERGRIGIYTQAFDPLRNLPESRRPIAGLDRDDPSESFGIARDGSAMTVSVVDQLSGVMLVDGAIARAQ